MTKALICGISGQDGAYLSRLLLQKGYEVIGTSRDAEISSFKNLVELGVRDKIELTSMVLTDFRSVLQTLSLYKPEEIYNLAGQSSVGLSFQQPVETMESIGIGTLNLLEVVRYLEFPTRIYNACSGECFGDTGLNKANENTPFNPRSPYAVAKATSFWEVVNYRESYGLFASNGLLFNHESSLRPERFVTRKIISTALRIKNGSQEKLTLGNIEIFRDWGLASEYVDAMWRMLQFDKPDDFVIATGESNSLKEFCRIVFSELELNWEDYYVQDKRLFRPSEIVNSQADTNKANNILGWQAKTKLHGVIRNILHAETE